LETLTDILLYHVTPTVLTSDKLSEGATAVTAQGGEVTISLVDGVFVNGIPVIEPDILAVNGVTHGISGVLIPPVETTAAPTDAPTTESPTAAPTNSAASGFGTSVSGLLVMVLALAF